MDRPPPSADTLARLIAERFDEPERAPLPGADAAALCAMAGRGSVRAFAAEPLAPEVIRTLCAVALSAPSKSDLQQRDIVLLTDPFLKARVAALVTGQEWVGEAPHLAVFCGNNRRQRQLHAEAGIPFANDHLDAFFNAAVDAGIALGAFVTAAEALGLGCCPISGIRNNAAEVAKLIGLPDHVFPVAGLAFGTPAAPARLSQRLPLKVTVHENRFGEEHWPEAVTAYDASRRARGDYPKQRAVETYGESATYSWSEDKLRQYSFAERAEFGAYIRAIGFRLE